MTSPLRFFGVHIFLSDSCESKFNFVIFLGCENEKELHVDCVPLASVDTDSVDDCSFFFGWEKSRTPWLALTLT